MNKRFKEQIDEYIYHGEKIPFSIGTIVVCFLCLLFLIVATFTQFDINHIWHVKDAINGTNWTTVNNTYIPQVPVVIFIAALLGPIYSLAVIIMYLLIGFFIWPVFALGGGLGYVKSPMFGYILGYVFAVIPSGHLLFKKYSLKNMILATILGVLIIHICGIIYCVLLGLLKLVSLSYITAAIHSISGIRTFYDVIISLIFLIIAIPAKYVLWIAMRSVVTLKPRKKFNRDDMKEIND